MPSRPSIDDRGIEPGGFASAARALTRTQRPSAEAVFGLCICGGLSRRMGRDKAELEVGGRTLLERAVATLSEVAPEVLLATGGGARYAGRGCRVVLDRYADAGPLAGLEAGLAAVEGTLAEGNPGAFVVVLPCDMPRVDGGLLRALLERAVREAGLAAALLTSASGPEPLCGVYHTRALHAIRAALDAGERKVLSFLRHPAANGELPRVSWTAERELCAERSIVMPALNLNSPEDLSAERARWATQESA